MDLSLTRNSSYCGLLISDPHAPTFLTSLWHHSQIKLHFSHFKILPDERQTCFRDPPHQCAEFAENGGGGGSAPSHDEF